MGSMMIIGGLTNRGEGGGAGGGADAFIQLLQGFGGGGGEGGGARSTGNIVKILLGLCKSYFNVKGGSGSAIKAWDSAGAGENQNDKNFLSWAMSIIRDLLFPGKKPKEIIEQGGESHQETRGLL